MFQKFVLPILYFIPLTSIQLVVIPFISINDISPNLLIVLIVYYTLFYGQIYGMVLGFVLGFLFDIVSGGFVGASMLSFTVSAFATGYFYNENKIDTNTSTLLFTIIVFVSGSLNSFLYSTVTNKSTDVSIIYLIIASGILPGIYTSIFSLPLAIFKNKKGIV